MPSKYEEHCRKLGDLAALLVEVVKEIRPLQTYKESIDAKNHKLLHEVWDQLNAIGNDGLSLVERARQRPCAILLGTSSAGKTELLGSFLPKLRDFSGSDAGDTTPMLVRLRYPKVLNPPDHGRVNFLMPRDVYKLISDLPRIRECMRKENSILEAWDRVERLIREPERKRDASFEKNLYNLLKEWARELSQWAKVSADRETMEYCETVVEIVTRFDPDSKELVPFNPVPRAVLKSFLNKGEDDKKIAALLREKERLPQEEADKVGKTYFLMRTMGAITDLYIEEEILKDIDIYDTAGVRVGGKMADDLPPVQMVHSQIQAFKNRWGFERLQASVDIVVFILVLEEQQVDTEFQALFEECRKFGNLKERLFIFLNKVDKAVDQAIKNKDYLPGKTPDEAIPDEEKSWKIWVKTNVMDKIAGLGEDFNNVFLCRAARFKFGQALSPSFLSNSRNSPTLKQYLFNSEKNIEAALDENDGGIKYAWLTVGRIMRERGSEIRYQRLARQIVPLAQDVLAALGAKRVTEEKPSDKEIDLYMERLLGDLQTLRWRADEFRLPTRFGEICIQKKFASSRQVEEALQIQKQTEEESGRRPRIGQIMVEKKFMTLEQVREVIQAADVEQEDWDAYQRDTFKHVGERLRDQIVTFMEDKGRPIITGNIPVESVIQYVMEPLNTLELELRGIYTDKERKPFQEAVRSVMECQALGCLWNQDRLRRHLWTQKARITSSFQIRDDISHEEALKVRDCLQKLKEIYDQLPPV